MSQASLVAAYRSGNVTGLMRVVDQLRAAGDPPDLSFFDFPREACIQRVDLRGAKFLGAKAWGVQFDDTDLSGADFTQADLYRARLVDSKLTGANFTQADMTGVKLDGVSDADLASAIWYRTHLHIIHQVNILRAISASLVVLDVRHHDAPDDPTANWTNEAMAMRSWAGKQLSLVARDRVLNAVGINFQPETPRRSPESNWRRPVLRHDPFTGPKPRV